MTTRYERHISLLNFSKENQSKLENAKVTVVGIGGVGTPIATLLTASGVGHLKLVDDDKIEISNLNRQFLYTEKDVGKPKSKTSVEKLKNFNSSVNFTTIEERVDNKNYERILDNSDVIVEGVDNFQTRFLINKYCIEKDIPYVHASAQQFQGQVTTIVGKRGPCLNCIFPNIPSKGPLGSPILGMAASLAGTYAACEVFKIITEWGEPLIGKMLIFDLKNPLFEIVTLKKRKDCKICGNI